MCKLLLFVIAMNASIAFGAPPDLHSPALVKHLATALTEQRLEAVAAQDPEDPNRFIAALFFPDTQLLVVSARYPSAEALIARLARKEYRDLYLDLSSSSQSPDSWFLQDMQADGLCSKRGQTADLLYEGTASRLVFDGDWQRHGESQADYEKQLSDADERYSRILEILIRQVQPE